MTSRDDQPDRPYTHTAGARPVTPRESKLVIDLELPTLEEREQGKRGIEAARRELRAAVSGVSSLPKPESQK